MGNTQTKKRKTTASNSSNSCNKDKDDPNQRKVLLVNGYIRKYAYYFISEINKICFMYYGNYAEHLVYFKDHGNWFKQNVENQIDIFKYANNKRLRTTPITQYIDDRYQIIFCSIKQFTWITWKGFLCIDMYTKEVSTIIHNNEQFEFVMDDNDFHLLISEPLELRSVQTYDNNKKIAVLNFNFADNGWLKPKRIVSDISDSMMDGNISSVTYKIWQQFEYNLWELFISNILYNPKKKIQDQEIWKIIQFLSLFYLKDYQCEQTRINLVIPYLIITKKDYKRICDEILDMNQNEINDHKSKHEYNSLNAKIIEYKDGKTLKCICFLVVDWGGGYATMGGFDKNIYCATFQIQKQSDTIDVKLDFQSIMKHSCDGYELS